MSQVENTVMPVMICSLNEETLINFRKLTDLPLVQIMWMNRTYDAAHIANYANGVKPILDLVIFGTNKLRNESINLNTQS